MKLNLEPDRRLRCHKPTTVLSMNRVLGFSLANLFAATVAARAQTVQTSSTSLPVATATSLTGSITVDGNLDEAPWAKATPITDFRQQQPHEGAPASQRTEVRDLRPEEHTSQLQTRRD